MFAECEIDVRRVDDALELVTACIEQQTGLLLIEAARLPDEFFDLKTRFAGEFIQKLQNYRLKLAICSPPTPRTASGSASSSARPGRVPGSGSSTTAWVPRPGCLSEG